MISGSGTKVVSLGAKEILRRSSALNLLLKFYKGRTWNIGSVQFRLTADKMRHILERHHPAYWNGSRKKVQSFLPNSWTTETIENAITYVLNSEKNVKIISNKKNLMGKFQIDGQYLGKKVTIGFSNGKIGQFYTH